ncbi:hypothetical protein BJV74DRAFT_881803 [Russula compacta]|nr:hypothetical protein BJV74DRAFT_881803 [Russula compacta]
MTSVLLPPAPSPTLQDRLPSSHPSHSNQSLSSSTSSSEDVNTPPSSLHATLPRSLTISLSPPYTSDEDHVLRSRSGSAPEYSVSGSRRIRFAPLPDPRRAVLVTEHGEELPLPSVFDDDDPSLRHFHTPPSSSLLLGDSVITLKEPPTIVSSASSPCVQSIRSSVSSPPPPSHTRATGSPTPPTATLTSAAVCSSSSTRLAKRLFYPFRQKNDDSRRSGSRDSSSSRDDTPPSWGIPLGHWASADEASRSTSTNVEPLSRTRSATTNPQPRTKRMLNGRVYGARKHQNQPVDVFQNIPDAEPEFVEWGYGGMGSVRAGGRWAKVQSDQRLFIGHTEARGRSGTPQASAHEDDDGSGMGWVKKRREERERKKREEQVAHETASKTNTETTPNLASSLVSAPETATAPVHHDISTVTPAQPTLADDDESSDESDEEVDDESSSTEQEDDDDDQDQNFKQVLGAGVERVSRHRD